MINHEDPLVQAERHVREGEQRILRQADLLKRHPSPEAERTLRSFEMTIATAREHLRIERAIRGIVVPCT